jgi:hypothetical protein
VSERTKRRIGRRFRERVECSVIIEIPMLVGEPVPTEPIDDVPEETAGAAMIRICQAG